MSTNQSPWPAAGGFRMMLQNPKMAFKLDELKSCSVQKDSKGLPKVKSGNFAGVYKATLVTNKNLCLRVFTKRAEDRRERYAAICEYLKSRKTRCLVEFEYLDGAIRHTDGKWYPLITMEWVEGNVLFDWLRERCEHNDTAALSKIHRQWAEVIAELADAGIAHGDLQHNNVMVTHGGEIKLVDYDGMVVPKLVGWDQLEWGVDPYQHPDRQKPETKLFTGLDNFSAIFIYVALGALAAEPVLWKQFIEPPGGEVIDKLLFKREDFEAPDQSQLISRLRNSPDVTVRKFVEHLLRVRRGPIADVPPLSGLLFDFDALRGLVQKLDWDAACQMLDESPGASVPNDLEATLRDARARVKLRKELHGAVEEGDEQAMARLADNALLKTNYPGVKDLLATASLARQVIPALNALDAAARDRKWRDYVHIWDQHARILSSRMSAMLHAAEVDQARQRNAACDHLLRLVAHPAPEVDALTAAWTALRKLGGHPEADAAKSRVEGLVDVRKSIEKLLRIPDVANEDNDRDLVDGWDDTRFGNQPEATDLRRRAQDAQARLLLVDAVRKLAIRAKGAPGLTADENTLLAIQKPELKGYRFRDDLLTVLKQMVARVASVRDWRTLLARSNATEAEIGAAWLQRQPRRTVVEDLGRNPARRVPRGERVEGTARARGRAKKTAAGAGAGGRPWFRPRGLATA
ncbi:MAG: protein kinase [Planctomycetota bacterium]|nr:protein kinase [Planctomycetota bacterium]